MFSSQRGVAGIIVMLAFVATILGALYVYGKTRPKEVSPIDNRVVYPVPIIPSPSPQIDTSSWKTYTSKKVEGLSFLAFSIKYPASWKPSLNYVDLENQGGPFSLTLTRDKSKIVIEQFAMGGGVCLFKGDKPFDGPGGDFVHDSYVEIDTDAKVMRRTYNPTLKKWEFCQDRREEMGYFVTPTSVGEINYTNVTEEVLEEMDAIVKTLKEVQ